MVSPPAGAYIPSFTIYHVLPDHPGGSGIPSNSLTAAVRRVSVAIFDIKSKTKFCYSRSYHVETGHENVTHVSDGLFVSIQKI